MWMRIEGVATSADDLSTCSDSIELAARAGRKAMDRANADPETIALLINAGIYRNEHVCEPALAAIIQKRLGIHTSISKRPAINTLAFDLLDSSCGLLRACWLAMHMLPRGSGNRALVVASDVHPAGGDPLELGFRAGGGAVILGSCSNQSGFRGFRFDNFDDPDGLQRGVMDWHPQTDPSPGRGNHRTLVSLDPDLPSRAAAGAAVTAQRLLSEQGLDLTDIDLFLPSSWPSGFGKIWAALIGAGADQLLEPAAETAPLFTAGMASALERAERLRTLPAGSRVLMSTVGSGLSAGAALYVV